LSNDDSRDTSHHDTLLNRLLRELGPAAQPLALAAWGVYFSITLGKEAPDSRHKEIALWACDAAIIVGISCAILFCLHRLWQDVTSKK
jgi:hypothetical protein